jgi:hypothetical protein
MRCPFSFAVFMLPFARTLPHKKHSSYCVPSRSAMIVQPKESFDVLSMYGDGEQYLMNKN